MGLLSDCDTNDAVTRTITLAVELRINFLGRPLINQKAWFISVDPIIVVPVNVKNHPFRHMLDKDKIYDGHGLRIWVY